jgi:hypothetical protein
MTFGTFGHPCEQTICVFGQPLVDVLEPVFSVLAPVKRRCGIA